jgi:hypothetical protein
VKSRDLNGQDQRTGQPWTWKWKKEDESDDRTNKHDRGTQRNPKYMRYLSGWKAGTSRQVQGARDDDAKWWRWW